MNKKYVEKRPRANGYIWAVNPPTKVREALEIGYEQYEDRMDAIKRSDEIILAYEAFKRGVQKDVYVKENSVQGLVSAYKRTNSWTKLSVNTKRSYNQLLRDAMHLRLGHSPTVLGEMFSRNVKVEHAELLYTSLCESISPHRANHVCKVLRRVWFVGLRLGKVRFNPFQKMGLKKLESRTVLWSPEQVSHFIDTADKNNLSSIGTLALLCYDLCQRPGDMRQLMWSDYDQGVFKFKQEKTGTLVRIPASPRLQDRMSNVGLLQQFKDKWDREIKTNDNHIILYENTGKPFDRRMYSKVAARVRNMAKLPQDLQIRDLRRTGATEMAEAGCTEDELRSVTGHQSRDVLSIYVRPTDKLAAAGINKRFS
jgi:integrase